MKISVQHDIKTLTSDLKKIKESAVPKATVQALNRTGRGVKTDSVREVSRVTSIKQKEVRQQIKGPSDKFNYKATRQKPVVIVNASEGRARNLINSVTQSARKPNHFNSWKSSKSGKRKYRNKGVRAKAWGKSKVYDGTFIGTGRNSNAPLVFARTSKGRTPLKAIVGPSVRVTFDSAPVQTKIRSMAGYRFEKEMKAAVKNQLRIALGTRSA